MQVLFQHGFNNIQVVEAVPEDMMKLKSGGLQLRATQRQTETELSGINMWKVKYQLALHLRGPVSLSSHRQRQKKHTLFKRNNKARPNERIKAVQAALDCTPAHYGNDNPVDQGVRQILTLDTSSKFTVWISNLDNNYICSTTENES